MKLRMCLFRKGGRLFGLLALCWSGFAAPPIQAQTCLPDSIPATTPGSRFTVHGDGTVTDHRTRLMWKQCSEGQTGAECGEGGMNHYTWPEALARARTVNEGGGFAGFTDWRLPNIKELRSIVERQCYDPAINLAVFPNATSNWHWSGSPNADDSNYALYVSFSNGGSDYYYRTYGYAVRLVRGGQ